MDLANLGAGFTRFNSHFTTVPLDTCNAIATSVCDNPRSKRTLRR
jgi:hypothetical protein